MDCKKFNLNLHSNSLSYIKGYIGHFKLTINLVVLKDLTFIYINKLNLKLSLRPSFSKSNSNHISKNRFEPYNIISG